MEKADDSNKELALLIENAIIQIEENIDKVNNSIQKKVDDMCKKNN